MADTDTGYSISISGKGAEPDEVREAFGTFVRELRAANCDGESAYLSGSLSIDGIPLSVSEVGDEPEAADVDEDIQGETTPKIGEEPVTEENKAP